MHLLYYFFEGYKLVKIQIRLFYNIFNFKFIIISIFSYHYRTSTGCGKPKRHTNTTYHNMQYYHSNVSL